MAIPHATVLKLQEEGITSPDDLADFDKDTMAQVAENLRKPNDRVSNPDKGAPAGSTIPRPAYVFGAKSQKRLLEACDLIRYYETTGRPLTAPSIRYNVIKNFTEQWKALKARNEEDPPDVPKITRTLPILKWTEAFDDYLNRKIGNRMIPLPYVVRETVAVPTAPNLANDCPHSTEHGSVEAELIARAGHNHPRFRDDNAQVYYLLEEATRSTAYAASLKPFQRTKNGRAALISLRTQYAGRDKWEAEIKRQDDFLHTRQWKGQTNFSLEKFVAQHRNAYVSMQQCSEHIAFQLPNEHTRVGYLLDAIQTSDAGLQAAMAQIQTDDGANGKRNKFEATASYLLPYDPVIKKRRDTKNDKDGLIGDTQATEIAAASGFGTKPGIGKTGVHLRFHTKSEYSRLTPEQKLELKTWREHNKGKAQHGKPSPKHDEPTKSSQAKQIAAAVSKEVAKRLKRKNSSPKDDDDDDSIDAMIMSLQAGDDEKPPKPKKVKFNDKTTVNTSALRSILCRVKDRK